MTLGKRCARLDLRDPGARAVLERLLREADVLVHGYRPDALAGLGLSAERRRQLRPVSSMCRSMPMVGAGHGANGVASTVLVQMSAGIADAGMRRTGSDRPVPLPVQAHDHATGYLMAAAAVRGLAQRLATGLGCEARGSLARTAALLIGAPADRERAAMAPEQPNDRTDLAEQTAWGPAGRLETATRRGRGADGLGPSGGSARRLAGDVVAGPVPLRMTDIRDSPFSAISWSTRTRQIRQKSNQVRKNGKQRHASNDDPYKGPGSAIDDLQRHVRGCALQSKQNVPERWG